MSDNSLRCSGRLADKTELIQKMVTTGKFYFLSRPRRFGKSLLVSTLKALFQGKKELFEGLWIEDKWDWSKTHPVIHLSFDAMGYKNIGLDNAITEALKVSLEVSSFASIASQDGPDHRSGRYRIA